MEAYLITIGDEILIGQTINTNAGYIGEKLSGLQIKVAKGVVIPDDEEIIIREFDYGLKNYDIVLVTGGLGPTHDDMTRKCIVKYFETELVFNEGVFEEIKTFFAKRDRVITEVNKDQAFVPKIATVINNRRGTAPGTWIEKDGKIFISMPGVPHEMKGMMEDFVIPKLSEITRGKVKTILMDTLLTTGIPESVLYEKLGSLEELLDGGKIAFLPSQYGVKVRVTVEAEEEKEAKNKLSQIEQRIRSKVGRFIYGKGEEKLEGVIGRLLADRALTLATAESCTGGLISSRITDVSGSSKYFERGIVSYSNGAKVELLHVDEDTIAEHGAVSEEVCRQMAEGVRAVSGTDLGLAVTGIMGPTGESEHKPIGLVYIGVCDENNCTIREFHFGDDRILNKQRTSQAALDMLRRHVLGIPYDD